MLKNRNILSSTRLSKKNIKPQSEAPSQPKISRLSVQINSIITSLERNVKDLKSYYRQRQSFKGAGSSLAKNKSAFRLKKVLHRNGSQTNLTRPHSHAEKHSKQQDILHSDSKDKNLSDVFEVGRCFLKMYGRQTTNIVELYEFYKKNIEKKDKSTRILASMDMSNPHMGLSLQVGKESMLRPEPQHDSHKESLKQQEKLAEQKITADKLQSDNKHSNSSKLDQTGNTHKSSRPSHLANDLMSKGLYNIANVANLMISKKYKLTKQKQESFQRAKLQREKVCSLKMDVPKQNNERLSNTGTLKAFAKEQAQFVRADRAPLKIYLPQKQATRLNENDKSSNVLDLNVSFQQTKKQQPRSEHANTNQQDSKSTQKRSNIADVEEFQISSIKKIEDKLKIDQLSDLQESPIAPQKLKTFQKSKYYVQPIPDKRKIEVEEEQSMTLKSNSRIIDIDSLPFDL